MKLIENSLLEIPIRILFLIFPSMREYYGNQANRSDAYEHFYTGFIIMLLTAVGTIRCHHLKYFVPETAWFFHYIVKEVLVDGWNKHWIKKYIRKLPVDAAQMQSFKIDSITRNAGFVFGLPFLVFAMVFVKY